MTIVLKFASGFVQVAAFAMESASGGVAQTLTQLSIAPVTSFICPFASMAG